MVRNIYNLAVSSTIRKSSDAGYGSFKVWPTICSLFLVVVTLLSFSCASKEVKKEPLDPKAMLLKADKLIGDEEYEEARRLLNEVKGSDTTIKYAPIAQLKIAESYAKEDNPEEAVSEYKRFIELYPDSQYAPYAQYQIAMLYFSRIQGPERGVGEAKSALKEFRKLRSMYPRNPYKEIVDINIKKCLNIIAEYEFIVGKFYFDKDSYGAALGRFLGILKNYPDYIGTERVLYYIALSYRHEGDKDNALKYLKILKNKFPEGKYVKELAETFSEDE
ncbi:outer membrane protein assembly factor BamD precursor [bacterium BMS3Bbin05]|nr:outer membrane protein assembly factor BamD precursor [bacterium BMS3Bbin05]